MGDHDQRHTVFGQLPNHTQHLIDQFRVQRRGDFVAQQHLRRHGQCPGDCHALLLPAGQSIRECIKLFPEPYSLQHFARQFPGFGLRYLLHNLRGEHHVFANGQVGEQVELLEHHPDLLSQSAQVGTGGVEVFAVDFNHAIIDRLQAIERAQQGRFARATAADDCHHLAFLDTEVDAFEHVVIAVIFMQGGNSKQRHAVSFPGSAH